MIRGGWRSRRRAGCHPSAARPFVRERRGVRSLQNTPTTTDATPNPPSFAPRTASNATCCIRLPQASPRSRSSLARPSRGHGSPGCDASRAPSPPSAQQPSSTAATNPRLAATPPPCRSLRSPTTCTASTTLRIRHPLERLAKPQPIAAVRREDRIRGRAARSISLQSDCRKVRGGWYDPGIYA